VVDTPVTTLIKHRPASTRYTDMRH